MNIDKMRAELRRSGARSLLRMAINQKEARCILVGLCPFYLKYQGVGFCISELMGHSCQAEKFRKLEEERPLQVDEMPNLTLALLLHKGTVGPP